MSPLPNTEIRQNLLTFSGHNKLLRCHHRYRKGKSTRLRLLRERLESHDRRRSTREPGSRLLRKQNFCRKGCMELCRKGETKLQPCDGEIPTLNPFGSPIPSINSTFTLIVQPPNGVRSHSPSYLQSVRCQHFQPTHPRHYARQTQVRPPPKRRLLLD